MGSSSFSNPTSCVSTSLPNTIAKEEKKKNKKKGGGSGSGVKLSTDPQSVAARQRRHRISDRFKTLQSLVPGSSNLDTASMLEEAIQYVKFLKAQILLHQAMIHGLGGLGADHHDPDPVFLPEPNNNICPVVQFHDEHVDHLCDEYSGDIAVVEGEMGLGWPVSCFSGEGNGGAFDASM